MNGYLNYHFENAKILDHGGMTASVMQAFYSIIGQLPDTDLSSMDMVINQLQMLENEVDKLLNSQNNLLTLLNSQALSDKHIPELFQASFGDTGALIEEEFYKMAREELKRVKDIDAAMVAAEAQRGLDGDRSIDLKNKHKILKGLARKGKVYRTLRQTLEKHGELDLKTELNNTLDLMNEAYSDAVLAKELSPYSAGKPKDGKYCKISPATRKILSRMQSGSTGLTIILINNAQELTRAVSKTQLAKSQLLVLGKSLDLMKANFNSPSRGADADEKENVRRALKEVFQSNEVNLDKVVLTQVAGQVGAETIRESLKSRAGKRQSVNLGGGLSMSYDLDLGDLGDPQKQSKIATTKISAENVEITSTVEVTIGPLTGEVKLNITSNQANEKKKKGKNSQIQKFVFKPKNYVPATIQPFAINRQYNLKTLLSQNALMGNREYYNSFARLLSFTPEEELPTGLNKKGHMVNGYPVDANYRKGLPGGAVDLANEQIFQISILSSLKEILDGHHGTVVFKLGRNILSPKLFLTSLFMKTTQMESLRMQNQGFAYTNAFEPAPRDMNGDMFNWDAAYKRSDKIHKEISKVTTKSSYSGYRIKVK